MRELRRGFGRHAGCGSGPVTMAYLSTSGGGVCPKRGEVICRGKPILRNYCGRPDDARTDDHAGRSSPRPRDVAGNLGSETLETAPRSVRREPARGMLFSATEEMDAALPPPFEFARSIARLYLTNLCHAAIAEPGGAVPELPPPPADLERAVLQAPPMTGLEYLSEQVLVELVARPGFTRPERDQEPPRRHARLSARAQPAMAIRRSRDVASGGEQAESGLSVRLSRHVRQRFDAAGQGEARTPGPGASAVRRGTEPRGDAHPSAPDFESRRILGIDSPTRRFRGDLSPPRVVAEGSVRVPQGDTAVRIERTDRAGARLVERPEAGPAPRQREDRHEEFGGHRGRFAAGVFRRRQSGGRNARSRRDCPVARVQRRPDPAEREVGRGRSREAE